MNIAVHQRPGVYSSYDASSVVSGSGAGRLVGIVAVNTKATAGVAQTVTTYDQAVTAFGSGGEEDLAEMIRLALRNGASGVVAVPVANAQGYEDAFEQMAGLENIAVVLCDSTEGEVQQALRDSVEAASQARRERLAVVAGEADETVSELTASELNRLSATLNNGTLTEEAKRMRVTGMLNTVILSEAASQNFEQGMTRQQGQTENLRR